MLLCFACKDRDETNPNLDLLAPSAPLNITAGDTLEIIGSASDETGLSQVSATLLFDQNAATESNDFRPLEELSDNFAFGFVAGDRLSPGGAYTLRVRVTDAAGNFTSRFIPVSLTEMPRSTFGCYLTGADGQDNHEIFRINAGTETIQSFGTIGAEVTDFQVDPYFQYLLYCSASSSRFSALRAEDPGQVIWEAFASNGAAETAFTGFSGNNANYLAVLGISPFGRVYDQDGRSLKTINSLPHPATAIARREDRFVIGQSDLQQTTKRIDLYQFDTQTFLKSHTTGWDVAGLAWPESGRIIGCGNGPGGCQILLFDENLNLDNTLSPAGNFVDMDCTGPECLVLTDQGLFQVDLSGQSLSNSIYSGSFSALARDPESGDIYLGGLDEVVVISPTGTLKKTHSHGFGQVNHLSFWTNK